MGGKSGMDMPLGLDLVSGFGLLSGLSINVNGSGLKGSYAVRNVELSIRSSNVAKCSTWP